MTSEAMNLKLYNAYIRPYLQTLLNIYPILKSTQQKQLESLNRQIFRIIYQWVDARNVETENLPKYQSISQLTSKYWIKLKQTILDTNPNIVDDYLQHKLSILYLQEYMKNPTLMRERRKTFGKGRIRKTIHSLICDNRPSLFDYTFGYQ